MASHARGPMDRAAYGESDTRTTGNGGIASRVASACETLNMTIEAWIEQTPEERRVILANVRTLASRNPVLRQAFNLPPA
jgi:hypothetical protein